MDLWLAQGKASQWVGTHKKVRDRDVLNSADFERSLNALHKRPVPLPCELLE